MKETKKAMLAPWVKRGKLTLAILGSSFSLILWQSHAQTEMFSDTSRRTSRMFLSGHWWCYSRIIQRGAPGWLGPFSTGLPLRSFSQDPTIQSHVGLPCSARACLFSLPLPLPPDCALSLSLSLSQINKLSKKSE